ncbi:hypothetical protein D3C77_595560 [compost metagenome]
MDQSTIDAITGHAPETIASKHYDGGATIDHKLAALMLLPLPTAVGRLISYQANFVDRYGNMLTKGIEAHRKKHARST